jgi:hypothetical protein
MYSVDRYAPKHKGVETMKNQMYENQEFYSPNLNRTLTETELENFVFNHVDVGDRMGAAYVANLAAEEFGIMDWDESGNGNYTTPPKLLEIVERELRVWLDMRSPNPVGKALELGVDDFLADYRAGYIREATLEGVLHVAARRLVMPLGIGRNNRMVYEAVVEYLRQELEAAKYREAKEGEA